jgi:hypothetical protein
MSTFILKPTLGCNPSRKISLKERRIVPKVGSVVNGLDPRHYQKLRECGLTDDTIERARIYSERDSGRLRKLLGGIRANAPALILPGFNRHGRRTGYDVARFFPAHKFKDGRQAKYLMARGQHNRAYCPPFAVAREAVNSPGKLLLITEGILKALAATQAGVPTIGLMGLWNWVVGGSDPRQLIPDLEEIDWRGRPVLVVFDYDPVRKPGVHHGAAELARVLSDHGAEARSVGLPAGPRGADGVLIKQGLDEFTVNVGEAAFRCWVQAQAQQQAGPAARALADWRGELEQRRLGTLGDALAPAESLVVAIRRYSCGGVFLDRSPMGAGKSHADVAALNRLEIQERRSLTLVPTHGNCAEVEDALSGEAIACASYPNLGEKTCEKYEEAGEVIKQGLVFPRALCPTCEYAEGCPYRQGYERACEAAHAIATHKRGEVSMNQLTDERSYIAIHEDPHVLLVPQVRVDTGFVTVASLAEQAERRLPREADSERAFYRRMAAIATDLDGWVESAQVTRVLAPPKPAGFPPEDLDAHLWEVICDKDIRPSGDALRLIIKAACGELDSLAVLVEPETVGDGVRRSIVAQWRTRLPEHVNIWVNDATASKEELEALTGRQVQDRTPEGRLERQWPVLQIASDVTQKTTPDRAAALLRGILYDLEHQRVGVITHKRLVGPLPGLLGPEFSARIAKLEHFRSGASRGSNAWMGTCDALVVLGTPRVPPEAVRAHLLRLGNVSATRLDQKSAGWSWDYWSGLTQSRRRRTIRTPHYTNHDWHQAYCALVVRELAQAVGRARPILEEGMPVYLVTTEDLGETVADAPCAPLTQVQVRVLGAMCDQRGEPVVCSAPEIARSLGLTRQRVRYVLTELCASHRVGRAGKKWVARRRVASAGF